MDSIVLVTACSFLSSEASSAPAEEEEAAAEEEEEEARPPPPPPAAIFPPCSPNRAARTAAARLFPLTLSASAGPGRRRLGTRRDPPQRGGECDGPDYAGPRSKRRTGGSAPKAIVRPRPVGPPSG